MKLGTRHLASYLPYKLKCKVIDKGIEKTATLNGLYDDGSCVFADLVESEQGFESLKPILRPMSDLDLDWIIKITKDNDIERFNMNIGCGVLDIGILYDNEWVGLMFHEYQKLFEWHFDVFGLINKGLAIDINTL